MRFFRITLLWLARAAGVVGLCAGGKSLGQYALARLKDPYFDSFSYNDLIFNGGVIFLLSLMVLLVAEVGQSLEKVVRAATTGSGGPESAKPAESVRKMTGGTVVGSASVIGTGTEVESPDEKLARLLKQKND